MCYYSSWAFYRTGYGKFDIDDIDPHMCTHLNYGLVTLFRGYVYAFCVITHDFSFANMNNQTWEIVAYDPWFDLSPNDVGCDRSWKGYRSLSWIVFSGITASMTATGGSMH